MMLIVKTLLHVIFPGVAGFFVAQSLILPQMIAWTAGVPGAVVMGVIATGLLTFALASVLRGWSIKLTRRFMPDPQTA